MESATRDNIKSWLPGMAVIIWVRIASSSSERPLECPADCCLSQRSVAVARAFVALTKIDSAFGRVHSLRPSGITQGRSAKNPVAICLRIAPEAVLLDFLPPCVRFCRKDAPVHQMRIVGAAHALKNTHFRKTLQNFLSSANPFFGITIGAEVR